MCQHTWTKGDRKGTVCGCLVKNPLRSFCSKHIKQNTDKPVVAPVQTRIIPDMNNNKNKSKVLRRNKIIDKLWHEETGMVFESIEDRRVISKLVDGELEDLTESDVEICKGMGFVIKEKPVVQEAPDEMDLVPKTPVKVETPVKMEIVPKTPVKVETLDEMDIVPKTPVKVETPVKMEIVKKTPVKVETPVKMEIVKKTPVKVETPVKMEIVKKTPVKVETPVKMEIVKNTPVFDRIKEVEDLLSGMQVSSREEEEEEELLEEEE
jgi:hypothetical protein